MSVPTVIVLLGSDACFWRFMVCFALQIGGGFGLRFQGQSVLLKV
jgi:hypothetical protein